MSTETVGIGRPHRALRPAQQISLAGVGALATGTILLRLPFAAAGEPVRWVDAFFTAASCLAVTGLTTVDTETTWSPAGQVILMVLIQLGGFGLMSLAAVLSIAVVRRLSLQATIRTAGELHLEAMGGTRSILLSILRITVVVEAVGALVLAARFAAADAMDLPGALWHGLFHAVSAFNNAGFALFSDNVVRYVGDPVVLLALACLNITGGLGFPVILEVVRRTRRPRHWSLTTKMVLTGVPLLLLAGTAHDYVDFGGGFVMVRMKVPASMDGIRATQARVAERHDVKLVASRPSGGQWAYVSPGTELRKGDEILVAGARKQVEAFGRLP